MSLSVSNINNVNYTNRVNNLNPLNKIAFKGNNDLEGDIVEISKNDSLSVEEKQEIMKSARKNAAGWSIFGGVISTIYYATRSDKTVAKKYDLDPQKDKAFIKQIKKDQTIWTIPGILNLGILSWIVASCISKDSIDV